MTARAPYQLPPDRQRLQQRAVRLQWTTLFVLIVVVLAMYLTMGSSQAMQTAWAEDILSLIPPIAYLIAVRVARKAPTEAFPYGYHRAISIAFLCTSVALLAMGLLLLGQSVYKLLSAEHPTIQSVSILGWHVWQGWVMVGTLAVTGVPPVILGRMKLPLAAELHDKALHADADMNKADWMTAIAGILGIIGISLGLWWADAAAAAFISLGIVSDGGKNLRRVIKDLMDRRPTRAEDDEPHPVQGQVKAALQKLSWVGSVGVRLREEGHVLTGEAFVLPNDDSHLVAKLEEAQRVARAVDWRICDMVITAVSRSPEATPDNAQS